MRKLKAERNVSIKWPLNFISITSAGENLSRLEALKPFADDLKNVTNAVDIIFVAKIAKTGQGLVTTTEDSKFEITIEFAEEASNSDAA